MADKTINLCLQYIVINYNTKCHNYKYNITGAAYIIANKFFRKVTSSCETVKHFAP